MYAYVTPMHFLESRGIATRDDITLDRIRTTVPSGIVRTFRIQVFFFKPFSCILLFVKGFLATLYSTSTHVKPVLSNVILNQATKLVYIVDCRVSTESINKNKFASTLRHNSNFGCTQLFGKVRPNCFFLYD